MIRRPMLFAACGCAVSVLISYYAGISGAAAGLFALSAAVCTHRERRRKRVAVLILVSYCLGSAAFWYTDRSLAEEAAQLSGSGIYGEITDCEEKKTQSGDPYLQMIVKTDQGRVLCKSYSSCFIEGTAAEGCMADLAGQLQEPKRKRNPGCFDYARYLKSLGITKTMICREVKVYPARTFREDPLSYIRYRVFLFREGFLERLSEQTDPLTGGLIRAVLFGDKGGLDEEVLESFRKNGTAHILAVSGLHIGMIYGFILKLWRWRRGWVFLLFNTVFFMFYAAAAGFSPSVTRAVIMVLLHIAAGIRNKRYDLANAAFLVFTGVILRNPYMIFNAGFQMSFLAVLSLTLVLPYMKRIYSGVFLASAAVQAGLGPFILYSFNYLSLITIIINVPVVALAGIIVPVALICMALHPFGLSSPAAAVLRPLCAALEKLNETVQVDGITTLQVPSPPLWIMAVYYLCLLLFATEEGRLGILRAARKGIYVLKMMIIIVMLSAGFTAFASDGFQDCNLTFVDVGQGDCVCVRVDQGILGRDRYFLFDGGGNENYNVGKSILREYLLKNGISHVDGAFVTHLHTDHYKGISELAKIGMVDRLYVYEANRLKASEIMRDNGIAENQLCFLARGDRISLSNNGLRNTDSVNVEVLHPKRHSDAEYSRIIGQDTDENLLSLVFRITYSGRFGSTGVLVTGDMGEEGEAELIRSDLQAEILKVGHHGSKTSTSEQFLTAVQPEIAVIQVGENNRYGHPTPETMQRLADFGAAIYRNDRMGAVGFEIRGGNVKKARTMIHDE